MWHNAPAAADTLLPLPLLLLLLLLTYRCCCCRHDIFSAAQKREVEACIRESKEFQYLFTDRYTGICNVMLCLQGSGSAEGGPSSRGEGRQGSTEGTGAGAR